MLCVELDVSFVPLAGVNDDAVHSKAGVPTLIQRHVQPDLAADGFVVCANPVIGHRAPGRPALGQVDLQVRSGAKRTSHAQGARSAVAHKECLAAGPLLFPVAHQLVSLSKLCRGQRDGRVAVLGP